MDHHPKGALSEALDRLSRLAFTEQTLLTMFERSAALAALGISGADMAGLALVRDGSVSTGGASEEKVDEVDSYQYASNEGPCLEAIKTNRVVSLPSTATDRRWPTFSKKAYAKGIGSVLSSPLFAGGRVIGSLNLYALQQEAFDEEDRDDLARFARAASTAIANACTAFESLEETRRLQVALDDCDLIGKATGVLMERLHLDRGAADISLRRDSNRRGLSLSAAARDVLGSVALDGV